MSFKPFSAKNALLAFMSWCCTCEEARKERALASKSDLSSGLVAASDMVKDLFNYVIVHDDHYNGRACAANPWCSRTLVGRRIAFVNVEIE